jgi:DNA-binding XRE family transcriptional regulator
LEENLVKKTCKELGINQKQLAEKIGVSRQTIYDWSSGKTPIPNWGHNFMLLLNFTVELISISLLGKLKFLICHQRFM